MKIYTVRRRGTICPGINMKKFMTVLFIVVAVAVTGYSAWQIISILQERYISRQEYDRARESYVSAIRPQTDEPENETDDDPFPDLEVDIAGLLDKNPDFAAWIYYEDASISYPVVQESGKEINKYLHMTFEETENSSGCIFMPYDADPAFRYMNTFIYGHNMKDGSMFGKLKEIYRTPDRAMDPYFYIWTRDYEVIRYRVTAAYVVDKDSEMYAVPLEIGSYREYQEKSQRLGAMNKYVKFTDEEKTAMEGGSPIVTLSTCYGSAGTSRRLLVQGVELERKIIVHN